MPTVTAMLCRRRRCRRDERAAAPQWAEHTHDGESISLMFTTPTGGLVLRQTVSKLVKQGAKTAGITAALGTHAGRRSVVTSLFVEGGEALEDIACFVGHQALDHRRLRQAPRPPPRIGRSSCGRAARRQGRGRGFGTIADPDSLR